MCAKFVIVNCEIGSQLLLTILAPTTSMKEKRTTKRRMRRREKNDSEKFQSHDIHTSVESA
jgi:hypothetical protein